MSVHNRLMPDDYSSLLAEIKERVRSAQYEALRAVNKELVTLYWDIGRMISRRQITGMHGHAVVEQLAGDLRVEFPAVSGFSRRNVFYMREFYLAYYNLPKVQPLVAQIGWTHNLIILQRCREPLEREFYLCMTKKFGWTKNVLIHQIENQSYIRVLRHRMTGQLVCAAACCTNFLPTAKRPQRQPAHRGGNRGGIDAERAVMKRSNRWLEKSVGPITFRKTSKRWGIRKINRQIYYDYYRPEVAPYTPYGIF